MKKLPTWVEVNLDHLAHNFKAIRDLVGTDVDTMLVAKADAYGLGAVQVARAAEGKVRMLGVATVDEAIELVEAGITTPILILSPILETEIPAVVARGVSVSISSLDFAQALSAYCQRHQMRSSIHVEIDTGMGRTGIQLADAEDDVVAIGNLPQLDFAGIYTHFPVSDEDPQFTQQQVEAFNDLVARVRARGVDVGVLHSANSGAVPTVVTSHMDMVRTGLLAYGHYPGGHRIESQLRPVLSWKSRVARVRHVPKGHGISYGRTFVTQRDSVIGVIPVGYGDGYPIGTSGKGFMIVGGRRVPIVGRVTMDMTMVDLTDLPAVPQAGDEVVLIGSQSVGADSATIGLNDIADWAGTIGYDIICNISKRVPRTYFRSGKVETYKSLLGILPNRVLV